MRIHAVYLYKSSALVSVGVAVYYAFTTSLGVIWTFVMFFGLCSIQTLTALVKQEERQDLLVDRKWLYRMNGILAVLGGLYGAVVGRLGALPGFFAGLLVVLVALTVQVQLAKFMQGREGSDLGTEVGD